LPYSICSLFFDIDDFHPRRARHHVVSSRDPDYVPPTSLSVAGPYLAAHPHTRLYTYAEIVEEDPQVALRRLEQETEPEWDDFVQLAFWRDGRLEAILGASWDHTHPGLSSEDRNFLEQLYPLIDASLYRLHALEAERVKSEGLESALEQMPLAMMMIGFDGELMFANQQGRRQCARWNAGLDESASHLRLPGEIDEMLEVAVGIDGDADALAASTAHIAHPSLAGLAIAVSVSWHAPGLHVLPCYVVVFQDENERPRQSSDSERPSDQRIASLQKLSPKERRVALMVAEGLRNEEIAQRLFRSRRTIEFQLVSAYRKLDVSSRTQLMRLLS
jgi:DNA-binding CsgD family transcriptional regulator